MRMLEVPTLRFCNFVVVRMEIDAQTAPFTTDSKEGGVVTRAKAIKLKDPESSPQGDWCQV